MYIIKNLDHLNDLEAKHILPKPHFAYLQELFHQLWEALSDSVSLEEFNLTNDGYIVVLEPSDNVRDLREIGLNPADGGLLAQWPGPEYVETVPLVDGTEIYKIFYLYDNDYGLTLLSAKGQFDQDIEQWLEEQCESR